MIDLWIVYNILYESNRPNPADRMFDEAKKQGINSLLLYLEYFSFINNKVLYKNEEIQLPKIIFYRGRNEKFIEKFELLGVKVINSSYSTIVCKDKYKTHKLVESLGLQQPKTYLLENKSYSFYENLFLNSKFLLKNRYGSQGNDIYLINNVNEYNEIINKINIADYIIQEYIKSSYGKDVRAYVIGNKVIGAMERINDKSFKANIAQGGLSYDFKLSKIDEEMTINIAKEIKGDIISVDYLFNDENKLIFCEANTNAGFASFNYLGYNVRKLMLEYIKSLVI